MAYVTYLVLMHPIYYYYAISRRSIINGHRAVCGLRMSQVRFVNQSRVRVYADRYLHT